MMLTSKTGECSSFCICDLKVRQTKYAQKFKSHYSSSYRCQLKFGAKRHEIGQVLQMITEQSWTWHWTAPTQNEIISSASLKIYSRRCQRFFVAYPKRRERWRLASLEERLIIEKCITVAIHFLSKLLEIGKFSIVRGHSGTSRSRRSHAERLCLLFNWHPSSWRKNWRVTIFKSIFSQSDQKVREIHISCHRNTLRRCSVPKYGITSKIDHFSQNGKLLAMKKAQVVTIQAWLRVLWPFPKSVRDMLSIAL